MKKCFLLLVFFATLSGLVTAQKISVPPTAAVAGFSAERLKRVDTKMKDWVQKGWMPGGVALVIHDGKVPYYNAVGFSNLESKTAMKKDDIFRIASQTKAITSVA